MDTRGLIKRYWKEINRRWWIPVALAAVGVGGATYQFGHLRFVGSALLLPVASPEGQPDPNTPGQPAQLKLAEANVVNDIIQMVGSPVVAERVARHPKMPGIKNVLKHSWASNPKGTNLVLIQAIDYSPEGAAALANTVAAELIDYYRRLNSANASRSREFIGQQLAKVRQDLEASDHALQAAREDPLGLPQAGTVVLNKYYESQTALDDARTTLRGKDARLADATAQLRQLTATQVSQTDVEDNPVYRQMLESLTALEIQKAQLDQVFTPEYPGSQQLSAQISELRARLSTVPKTRISRQVVSPNPVYARLQSDMSTVQEDRADAEARTSVLGGVAQRYRATLTALAPAQTRVAQLARENDILATESRSLTQRYEAAVLAENSAQSFPFGLQVVQNALPPVFPWPWYIWIALAACAVGLVIGSAIVVGLDALDERVRTREDIERELGAPVLVEVPMVRRPRTQPVGAGTTFMNGIVPVLWAGPLAMLFALMTGLR